MMPCLVCGSLVEPIDGSAAYCPDCGCVMVRTPVGWQVAPEDEHMSWLLTTDEKFKLLEVRRRAQARRATSELANRVVLADR